MKKPISIPSYGVTTALTMMEPGVFGKFSQPDHSLAWCLVQDDAARQLLGIHVSTVPSLKCAEKFELLSIYVKEKRTLLHKVKRKVATYVHIGKLREILVPGQVDPETLTYLEDAQTEREKLSDTARYIQSDLKEGLRKTIEIDSDGIEKHVNFLSVPGHVGRLVVNRSCCPALRETKNLYVINEVYYAKNLRIVTRIGAVENVQDFPERTPVAFNYLKIELEKDGAFGEAKEVEPGRKAHWLYDIPKIEDLNSQENIHE